jgi:SAM-dependent methyltransferase
VSAALPLDLLACPACRGELLTDGSTVRCASCGQGYADADGFADLVPSGVRAGMAAASSDPRWARWREAIRGLDAWRARRRARSGAGPLRPDGTSEPETRALFEAAGVRGVVVDVGARNGGKRALMPEATRYVGVDPFPASGAALPGGSVLVRGVAEALPLRSGVADVAVSLAAFDYFVDGRAALAEMHRVLRPSGRLALLVSVVPASVARARQAPRRRERALRSLRAAGDVGPRAALSLLDAALRERDRPHTHYYTAGDVRAMLAERFELLWSRESPQAASTILYLAARARSGPNG